MKTALSILASLLLVLGGLYALSLALDAAHLIKMRFHGPFIELPASGSAPSAIDLTRLQQACGTDAEPSCTPVDQAGDVIRGGLGLKGSFSLGHR